jgi:hypothetical protein
LAKFRPGDILSYPEMCLAEGFSLQHGMNFRTRGGTSVILMSTRRGAPYNDRVEENGRVLIYEGHDVPSNEARDPKAVDQQALTPRGAPTRNGRFAEAAKQFKQGKAEAELVQVYEKVRPGIWVYNGLFRLLDAWMEKDKDVDRKVFKFKLEITDRDDVQRRQAATTDDESRMIPTVVKLEVWKRDKGRCRQCGSDKNLHFDHIIPWSKGGDSLTADNIQLLCAKHNIQKRDRIQ